MNRFLARVCGVGTAPPDPREEVPPRLKVPGLRCGKYRVRHEPRRFLDGTEYPLFRWNLLGPRGPDDELELLVRLDVMIEAATRDCPEVMR